MTETSHLLFVGSGGMGSTHLVHSIRSTGTPCVEKPNIESWYPERWPPVIRVNERVSVARLDEPPTPATAKRFRRMHRKRSNTKERFSLDETKTLADNMVDYFAFLRSYGIACVLEACAVEGLVSYGRLRNVVFLVRDPVQSYVSFARPIRHGRYIDKLGGIDSEDAIAFWAWTWNSLADEYFQAQSNGLDPVLVRYEFTQADARRTGDAFLEQVFASFRPRWSEPHVSERTRRRLLELIGDRYEQIYGEKQVGAAA